MQICFGGDFSKYILTNGKKSVILQLDFKEEITKRYASFTNRNVRNSKKSETGMMVHAFSVDCFPILLFKVIFLTTSIRDVVYSATLCFCSLFFSIGTGERV